jgi:hypothetical protein
MEVGHTLLKRALYAEVLDIKHVLSLYLPMIADGQGGSEEGRSRRTFQKGNELQFGLRYQRRCGSAELSMSTECKRSIDS